MGLIRFYSHLLGGFLLSEYLAIWQMRLYHFTLQGLDFSPSYEGLLVTRPSVARSGSGGVHPIFKVQVAFAYWTLAQVSYLTDTDIVTRGNGIVNGFLMIFITLCILHKTAWLDLCNLLHWVWSGCGDFSQALGGSLGGLLLW